MHPIAFKVGTLTIHWYGVMVALAFLAGVWTASRRALRAGIGGDKIADLAPWLIVGAIVGARLLYVVTYWREQFAGGPVLEIFMIHHGGLVFYGGLIGAALACVLYCRFKTLPLWTVADILAPSIALGNVFGRIGCLLNGCCFGRACELPWAIRYPATHESAGLAVHPTPLYDALLNLALYAGLAWLFRRRQFNGQVFAAFLLGYALTRSTAEVFRGDYPEAHRYAGLTPAHLVSVGIFLAGLVLFWWLRRQPAARR